MEMQNQIDVGGIVINKFTGEIIAYTHDGMDKLSKDDQLKFIIVSLLNRCKQAGVLY